MTPEREMKCSLPPAPGTVENAAGLPAFGAYAGELPEVDLRRLSGSYGLSAPLRLLKHKRWVYTLVATPEVVAAFSIADLSYTANSFAVVVDLVGGKVVLDTSHLGLSGPLARVGNRPGEGLSARFRTLGARLGLERGLGRERYEVDVDVTAVPLLRPGMRWRGSILAAGGPTALTVISPVREDGVVNVTQKRAGMLALGTLEAGGRTWSLDGGVAGMDYTNGYLARHTAWRWAFGLGRLPDGTAVGLNLSAGIHESGKVNENVLWLGDRMVPLGHAHFHFNALDVMDEWRVTTAGGGVDLHFRPVHVHRELRDYKLVRSRFLQPFGTFEGTVKVDGQPLRLKLSGVTEDQDILW